MLGITKQEEEAPLGPQRPLSPMGDACFRMDLTAIHQILVMTHYRDDEGTNEVLLLPLLLSVRRIGSFRALMAESLCGGSAVLPGVDPADAGHAGREEARGLRLPRQGLQGGHRLLLAGVVLAGERLEMATSLSFFDLDA